MFGGKQSPLKQLDEEIGLKEKEVRQCERVLEIMATKERMQIMENPMLISEILLESVRVRKECEGRAQELVRELGLLYERKEDLARFSECEDVCKKLKNALEVFKKSPSLRKKQLIQVMVPRLVVDEKKDELKLFLNPLLDKSIKNEDLDDPAFQPMVSLTANSLDRQKNEPVAEGIENFMEKQCHSEDESLFSGQMADRGAAMQTYLFPTIISRHYATLCSSSL